MGVSSWKDLIQHKGHKIVCISYGENDENIALECLECNEVLLDFDRPTIVKKYKWKRCKECKEKYPVNSKSYWADVHRHKGLCKNCSKKYK